PASSAWTALAVLPGPGKSAEHANRALTLLERALAAGYRNFANLHTEPDLEAVRRLPGYREVLARQRLLGRYSSAWREDSTHEATGLHGLTPEEHLKRCRELVAQGWRPVGLSLTTLPAEKEVVAASVWHRRTVPAQEQERLARRQGTAGSLLLRLG